jgi:DeoR/GlpR family transcriptional regulator of sugar metabolism
MLPLHRHQQILRQLQQTGSVRSLDLANHLGVSHETVRKDLAILHDAGELERTHGGAVLPMGSARGGLPLPERAAFNHEAKLAIAAAAVQMVNPRDVIFLDASSTVLRMAEALPFDIALTVITNAHHVVVALAKRPNITLISTGGTYEDRSCAYTGVVAEDSIRRYLVRCAFLGVDGLDAKHGAMDINPGHGLLKERLLPNVEKVIVLADHSKLGVTSSHIFARPAQIDLVISDRRADVESLKTLRQAGMEISIAEE